MYGVIRGYQIAEGLGVYDGDTEIHGEHIVNIYAVDNHKLVGPVKARFWKAYVSKQGIIVKIIYEGTS